MPSHTYELALTTIEWPREGHIPAIRCPITGMIVSIGFGPDQDPDEDAPLTPADGDCPTLMFRYLYETGMEYLHPELAAKIDTKRKELRTAGEDQAELDDFELITEYIDDLGQAPMIIDMSTAGIIGDGITIGFDLGRALPQA